LKTIFTQPTLALDLIIGGISPLGLLHLLNVCTAYY